MKTLNDSFRAETLFCLSAEGKARKITTFSRCWRPQSNALFKGEFRFRSRQFNILEENIYHALIAIMFKSQEVIAFSKVLVQHHT